MVHDCHYSGDLPEIELNALNNPQNTATGLADGDGTFLHMRLCVCVCVCVVGIGLDIHGIGDSWDFLECLGTPTPPLGH